MRLIDMNYNDYLVHHGILGQRWGKKNGPPYPLGSGDHSASERKAGWRASLKKSSPRINKRKSDLHLTDRQKKALKIGLIAAGTVLAVGAGVYIYKSGYFQNKMVLGRNALSKDEVLKLFDNKHKIDSPVDVILGNGSTVNIKHCATSKFHDLEIINSKLSLSHDEIEKVFDVGRMTKSEQLAYFKTQEGIELSKKIVDNVNQGNLNNCVQSTFAGVLRRMGYDVIAGQNPAGTLIEEVFNSFKDVKVESLYKTARNTKELKHLTNLKTVVDSVRAQGIIFNKLEDKITSQGNGAFGLLNIYAPDGNHAVEYFVNNNKLEIFDNQMKKAYSDFASFFHDHKSMNISLTTFARLDNCEPILDYMLENHFIKPF